MNIQQLRYLVAVSDFGSVNAAGRALGITQPVISRAIRAFEAEHRVTVFALCGRSLVPTEDGRAIVDAARDALTAIDGVAQMARRLTGRQTELVIATTPTNGLLLTPSLSEIGRCEPGLELRVCRASDTDDAFQKVRTGEAEIGFSDLVPGFDDRQLTAQPVAEEEVVLVSPTRTDLPPAVTWNDVVGQPLIVPPTGSDRRKLILEAAVRATGTTPHIALVTEDRGAWIAAAQAGMGSFLSYFPIVSGHDGVEIRPFEPRQTIMVGFVHRPGSVSSAATRFMELTRSELQSTHQVMSNPPTYTV